MLYRVLLVALLAASSAQAETIYVDVNCPGPGSGTQLDPYCSIQTAIILHPRLDVRPQVGAGAAMGAGVATDSADSFLDRRLVASSGGGKGRSRGDCVQRPDQRRAP